jgi:hypothetical protein
LWRGLDVQLSEKKLLDRDASPPRRLIALHQLNCCGSSYHYAVKMTYGPLPGFTNLAKYSPDFARLEMVLPAQFAGRPGK